MSAPSDFCLAGCSGGAFCEGSSGCEHFREFGFRRIEFPHAFRRVHFYRQRDCGPQQQAFRRRFGNQVIVRLKSHGLAQLGR